MLFLAAVEQLSREELCNHISLLRGVSIASCTRDEAAKFGRKGAALLGKGTAKLEHWFNGAGQRAVQKGGRYQRFGPLFEATAGRLGDGSQRLERYATMPVTVLQERIEAQRQEQMLCSVEVLRNRLLSDLAELAGVDDGWQKDPRLLSRAVLSRCARHLEIKNPSPDGVALENQIAEAFYHAQLQIVQEHLARQTDEEAAAFEAALDVRLEQLASADREAILATLKLDELSGRTLRRAIRSGALTVATLGSLNAAGMGAFLALSTALSALSLLVGVSFPFAVYSGASSGLGLLLGPAGALLVALVPAGVLFSQRKRLHDSLLAGVVSALHASLHMSGQFAPEPIHD